MGNLIQELATASPHSFSYNIHLNFRTRFSYIDSNFSVKYTFFILLRCFSILKFDSSCTE